MRLRTLDAPPADPTVPPVSGARTVPLRHLVALVLVLLALWVVGPRGHGFTDDGIALEAQVEALAAGSWSVPHPYPAVDPEGRFYPDRNAQPIGGPSAFGPYVKHPLVPLALTLPWRVAGDAGAELVVLAGLVAAGVAMARLVRRSAPLAAIPAFWLVGVGSVLVVHGFILWAHAWALAVAAVAVEAVLRLAVPGPGARRAPLVVLLAAVATLPLLRTEGALFALAVAATLAGTGLRSGRRDLVAVGGAVLGAAGLAVVVETWVVSELIGATSPPARPSETSWLSDRLWGSSFVLLHGGYSAFSSVLRLVGALALVFGAFRLRRGLRGGELRGYFAVCSLFYVASCLVLVPRAVPGLLPALPLVAAALALPGPLNRRDRDLLVPLAATYLSLLVLTVYRGGGGGDWGGRYAVLVVAAVAPLVAAKLVGLGAAVGRSDAGVVVGSLLAATVAVAPGVVLELARYADGAETARSAVVAELQGQAPAPATGKPVVVVVDHHLSRLLSLDQASMTPLRAVEDDHVRDLLEQLAAQDVPQVLVVGGHALGDGVPGAEAADWRTGPVQPLTRGLVGIPLTRG